MVDNGMDRHGPVPKGLQINHKTLVKNDNRPENLELVTPSENVSHAYASDKRALPWAHTTTFRGRQRMTDEEVRRAGAMRASGSILADIMLAFGISQTQAAWQTGSEGLMTTMCPEDGRRVNPSLAMGTGKKRRRVKAVADGRSAA